MNELTVEQTQELYNFLKGEEMDITVNKSIENCIRIDEDFKPKEIHLKGILKLTEDQAFSIIYMLQEYFKIIPDIYEQCDHCGEIYDSESEGHYINCNECSENGCIHYTENDNGEIIPCTEEFKKTVNYKHFCCVECECNYIYK